MYRIRNIRDFPDINDIGGRDTKGDDVSAGCTHVILFIRELGRLSGTALH